MMSIKLALTLAAVGSAAAATLPSGVVLPTGFAVPADLPTGTGRNAIPTGAAALPTDMAIPTDMALPSGVIPSDLLDSLTSLPTSIPDLGDLNSTLSDLLQCAEPALNYSQLIAPCTEQLNQAIEAMPQSQIDNPSNSQMQAWIDNTNACFCNKSAIAYGDAMMACQAKLSNQTSGLFNMTTPDNSTFGDNSTTVVNGTLTPAYLLEGSNYTSLASKHENVTYSRICSMPGLSFPVFMGSWSTGHLSNSSFEALRSYMYSKGYLKHAGESGSASSLGASAVAAFGAAAAALVALAL